jgi:hypothetical protein
MLSTPIPSSPIASCVRAGQMVGLRVDFVHYETSYQAKCHVVSGQMPHTKSSRTQAQATDRKDKPKNSKNSKNATKLQHKNKQIKCTKTCPNYLGPGTEWM